jgi:threonine dehydratase
MNRSLIRVNLEDAGLEIYLTLEILQPVGSFRTSGAAEMMRIAIIVKLKWEK